MNMTLRKYKKLLMSRGVDRNLAERERMLAARRNRHAVLLGIYGTCRYEDPCQFWKGVAERHVAWCGGSYRTYKKMISPNFLKKYNV